MQYIQQSGEVKKMFKVGDKAYFSEDTLRRVREENWRKQEEHWHPQGLTPGMAERIMNYDYIVVEGANNMEPDSFQAMHYMWGNSWFNNPIPNELKGAVKLV